MFVKVLLIFAAVAGFVTAEVPSYIQICGAKNPNLDQCVINSVNALAKVLESGIPELGVPASNPFVLEELTLADLPNFKAIGHNVKVYGLPTYNIESLHLNLDEKFITMKLLFKDIHMVADYDLNAKILIPISGKGPISMNAQDVVARVKMSFKLVQRGSKRYMYFNSMQMKLDAKDFDLKFESDHLDKTLQDAFMQALGSSHQEVLEFSMPYIEKAISEKCLDLANKICKRYSYEEFFPDRE
ncbi:uncharacterized protein LOC116431228 [Nomia melanderi]|uniref:uncharacterized protein LOC116431228 n=1 Tax=Nomia melanderi TaxID=2448451 RepID=UPI00130472D6|nr:uncharacterized protein LOC116431228 [Nomia melanderi]